MVASPTRTSGLSREGAVAGHGELGHSNLLEWETRLAPFHRSSSPWQYRLFDLIVPAPRQPRDLMATKKRRTGTGPCIADSPDRHQIPGVQQASRGAVTMPGYPPFIESRMHPSECTQQRHPPTSLSFGHLVVAAILGVSVVAVVVACTVIVTSRMSLPSVTTSPNRAAVMPQESQPSLEDLGAAGRPLVAARPNTATSSLPPTDAPPSDPSHPAEGVPEPQYRHHDPSTPAARAHAPRLIGHGRSLPASPGSSTVSPASTDAPPSETPPLGNGTVDVTPTPYGVLFVDGRRHGYTPITVQLPAGQHRLRVDREGYVSEERTLTVAPDGAVRWTPHLRTE